MKYFDITFKEFDNRLSERLGYSKLLVVGKDLDISENSKKSEKQQILNSEDPSYRALSSENVIGIVSSKNIPKRATFQRLAQNEKILFLTTSNLTTGNYEKLSKELYRIKKVFKLATAAKVKLKLISLAKNESELVSVGQKLALSRFIGAAQERSLELLSGFDVNDQ